MVGGHAEILKLDYVVLEKKNPTQPGKYVKMKKMTFSALDYGTSEIDLWSIVEK